jgi:hypothetical protein
MNYEAFKEISDAISLLLVTPEFIDEERLARFRSLHIWDRLPKQPGFYKWCILILPPASLGDQARSVDLSE